MPMKISPGSTLVMVGDSITEWGREEPLGDKPDDLIGNGYVQYVDSLVGAAYPGYGLRIRNMGYGGDTVRDLDARWQKHVLDLHPDWLSVMIGINDVWRQFDNWLPAGQRISIDEFRGTLGRLVRQTRPGLKGLILLTPYFVEPNRLVPMRAMMDGYGEVVRTLARENDAVLVDTQAAFDAVLEKTPAEFLAEDRVHVNAVGHMILARAFLKAIDFVW
jgi:lysophospholipase L1-like esterase